MILRGVIFDLDGTLVDSRLDFDRMRAEIGIPAGQPVLEFVEALRDDDAKARAHAVIAEHEFRGALEATLMPAVRELVDELRARGVPIAILTRNLRGPTRLTLERLGLDGFAPVLTREDAPPKPDPAGILHICRDWGCAPGETVFVGDYRFDILAGRNAGTKTVLYARRGAPAFEERADWTIACFSEWLADFEGALVRELGLSLQLP